MKNKICFIFVLFFVFAPYNVLAGIYSLDDLYRRALEKSETIKISEEDLYISEQGKEKALSTLLPDFSAFGDHTRYSKEKRQGEFLLQPDYTNEWGFRLGQTFSLSGKEFTNFRIAKEGIRQSSSELDAVKEEFLLNVASEYFVVLSAKKALEIALQNVERLTKHRDAARTRLEVGAATKTVLLRAEAELAGAQSDLIKAGNNLSIAKARLAQSVNLSEEYDVSEPQPGMYFTVTEAGDPDLGFLIAGCSLPELECLTNKALAERAEMNAAIIERDVAKEEVSVAQGAYWPDLSIEGVYVRQENEPSSTFGLTERMYGLLKLNIPIYEGGLRRAEVGEAKARARQAEYRLSHLERLIGVDVENSYLIVKREVAVLSQVRAEVEYARDNYNSVTKQFQYGLADSVDVMDANTLLVTAEREQATAEYASQLSVLRLQRMTGTLLKTVVGETGPGNQ